MVQDGAAPDTMRTDACANARRRKTIIIELAVVSSIDGDNEVMDALINVYVRKPQTSTHHSHTNPSLSLPTQHHTHTITTHSSQTTCIIVESRWR